MKKIFLFLSIIIFINSSVNYGQAVTRDQSGILLRFNMNQPDICDTVGNWHMRHSFYILNND
ncbi:MAG TPA: hypothetical protein VHO28_02205, partial [Ignavibacteriales bacterium]|nr:hypothetical protein [Ignavibacteriales bacterium]